MHITEQKKDGFYALKSKEINLFSNVEMKILYALSRKPDYPKNIARQLDIHEQNVYYHIKRLQNLGIIKIIRKEEHGGYLAKIYALSSPSFYMKFGELHKTNRISGPVNSFLEPFIENGSMNAKIVVGSPDPHGPERARSRDAYYAIDLGMFLGTYLVSSRPSVKLDTEISKDELKENIIIIGGPVVNKVTKEINNRLPIRFDDKRNLLSLKTKKIYRSDDIGLIVKMHNPFNKEKFILLIAGKRYSGTRAAILAFIKKIDEISRKNYIIVEGIDNDGDGIIDDVRILE